MAPEIRRPAREGGLWGWDLSRSRNGAPEVCLLALDCGRAAAITRGTPRLQNPRNQIVGLDRSERLVTKRFRDREVEN